jgi:hypothetical protein
MMKKLIVFVFMAVFVSYCPQFWGSEEIYKECKYVHFREG